MSFGADTPNVQKPPKTAGVDRTRFSTNEQRPIPLIFGGNRRFGAQFISNLFHKKVQDPPGGDSSGKGAPASGKKWYFGSFAVLICRGPALRTPAIVINDEVIHSTRTAFDGADYKDVTVTKGKHHWVVRFYAGTETQEPDEYLIAKSGVDHPAYRGWHYAVFHQMFFGLNQTDVPNLEFEPVVKPQFNDWLPPLASPWLAAANPAEIMADLLQHPRTGLAIADDLIDQDAFIDARAALDTEEHMLCAFWDRQQEARSAVNSLVDHIDASLLVSGDGKLGLVLNRPPADLGALPVVDESVMVKRPRRSAGNWLGAASETRLKWSRTSRYVNLGPLLPDQFEDIPPIDDQVIWRDRGLFAITGEPVAESVERPFINSQPGARNAVNAIGRRLAVPQSKGSVEIRKVGTLFDDLAPAALFKLQLPSRGLTQQICRVETRIDPSPGSPSFTIEYVVDYSWLTTAGALEAEDPGDGSEDEGPGGDPPDNTFAKQRIVELPVELSGGALALQALVRRDVVTQDGYATWIAKNFAFTGSPPDSYGLLRACKNFAQHGMLQEDYASGSDVDTVGLLVELDGVDLEIGEQTDWDAKSGNLLVWIEDEIVAVHTVELVAAGWYRLKCLRAMYGTTKVSHSAGADVFILRRVDVEPLTQPIFNPGYTATLKLAPIVGGNQADLATITESDTVLTGGFALPSRLLGSVVAWLKSSAGATALPAGWVECNGQTLDDEDSPYDGEVIPDLNGDQRFLRGAATSGTTGGSETHSHTYNSSVLADTGTANSVVENGTGTTDADHLPPYYEVVWIMRVK